MRRRQLKVSVPFLMVVGRSRRLRREVSYTNSREWKIYFPGQGEETYLECIENDDHYLVSRIPFVDKGICLGDKIKALYCEDDNKLYFERIEKPSGNSTILIRLLDQSYLEVIDHLVTLKCQFLVYVQKATIAISVPKPADYNNIEKLLLKGEKSGKCKVEFISVRRDH